MYPNCTEIHYSDGEGLTVSGNATQIISVCGSILVRLSAITGKNVEELGRIAIEAAKNKQNNIRSKRSDFDERIKNQSKT